MLVFVSLWWTCFFNWFNDFIFSAAGTPYAGGNFRVKLVLGKDFPQAPPKAYFLTKIFHPNVATNGEICVNTLKKDWKPDLGIKHILLVCWISPIFRIIHNEIAWHVSVESIWRNKNNELKTFSIADGEVLTDCSKRWIRLEWRSW